MALTMSYTTNAGTTHANSYWVITDIDMFKKLQNSTDLMRQSLGLADDERPEVAAPARDTTTGYYLHITVCGWKTATSRSNGDKPIAIVYRYPTKHPTWFYVMDEHVENALGDCEWDLSSETNMLNAAYTFLKTTNFFSNASDST